MRASQQRPAIRWDLMRRFAPNRSLTRFGSFNEAYDLRIGGLTSFFRGLRSAVEIAIRQALRERG
jgi:hypothetical protein